MLHRLSCAWGYEEGPAHRETERFLELVLNKVWDPGLVHVGRQHLDLELNILHPQSMAQHGIAWKAGSDEVYVGLGGQHLDLKLYILQQGRQDCTCERPT